MTQSSACSGTTCVLLCIIKAVTLSLHWRHNDHDGVSNHQTHGCLPKRLFRRRSKKTSKLRVTGLCVGNSPWPVNSPHKGPVTRKMFPFDDVIMARITAARGVVCLTSANLLLHTQWASCSRNEVYQQELIQEMYLLGVRIYDSILKGT